MYDTVTGVDFFFTVVYSGKPGYIRSSMSVSLASNWMLIILLVLSSCAPKDDSPRRFDLPMDDVLITVSSHSMMGDSLNPLLGVSNIKWIDSNFYITSGWQHQLFRYNEDGSLVKKIGREGRGPCDFNMPTKLVISGKNISVLEMGNSRIQVLSNHLECGEMVNLPFMPTDAIYHEASGSYLVVGSHYSGESPKFIHVVQNGEIRKSLVTSPDELIYSYYAANHGDHVIWGNNFSKTFYSVNLETGDSKDYQLLDTTFVSILEELADFEVKDMQDMRRLMGLQQQIPHSFITGVVFRHPYLLVSYQNRNSDLPNRLLIQDLVNGNILFKTTIGEYKILENRVGDGEFIL
jgi:hypothetical protein